MKTAIIWLVVIPIIAIAVTKNPGAFAHLMEMTMTASMKVLNASARAINQFLGQL